MFDITEIFKAIFLGFVEGLTEFIPVSSTAHLLLASRIINFDIIKGNVFEIAIQIGAVFAICIIYRQRIYDVVFKINERKNQKFLLNLILAFTPAILFGALLHDSIKNLFFTNSSIAIALIFGGIFMIAIELVKRKSLIDDIYKITPAIALCIGLFQCIAMIPGVSRSGATIIGAILIGLNRKTAAEFSFFLAIPTIAAASLYDLFKSRDLLTTESLDLVLIGSVASFVSSLLVIKWFLNFIGKNNFIPFGVYRIMVGLVILLA